MTAPPSLLFSLCGFSLACGTGPIKQSSRHAYLCAHTHTLLTLHPYFLSCPSPSLSALCTTSLALSLSGLSCCAAPRRHAPKPCPGMGARTPCSDTRLTRRSLSSSSWTSYRRSWWVASVLVRLCWCVLVYPLCTLSSLSFFIYVCMECVCVSVCMCFLCSSVCLW